MNLAATSGERTVTSTAACRRLTKAGEAPGHEPTLVHLIDRHDRLTALLDAHGSASASSVRYFRLSADLLPNDPGQYAAALDLEQGLGVDPAEQVQQGATREVHPVW